MGKLAGLRSEHSQQLVQLCDYGLVGFNFKTAIVAKHLKTKFCDLRAAALATAGGGCDQRLSKTAIHGIHQIPSALIGHAHMPGASRNRTSGMNRLQQISFTGPYCGLVAKRNVDLDIFCAHDACSAIFAVYNPTGFSIVNAG